MRAVVIFCGLIGQHEKSPGTWYRPRPGLSRFALCQHDEPEEGACGVGSLGFALYFLGSNFSLLLSRRCASASLGVQPQELFFTIVAAAIATAAFALSDRRINPAAKVICSRNYAQYDDNQLNIHVFTSCFPKAHCCSGKMCM